MAMVFSDIKGQDKALGIIKSYIESSRLAGGYIFSGPDSVGKKMAALALASSLNCERGAIEACGECPSCLKINKLQHPDVHLVLSEGAQVKIEDIRQLQKEMSLKPYEGRYKVFIIEAAHTLTAEAENCLLKVLEEPPAFSLIILVTDKPGMLFKTVISRCRMIKFSPLNRQELEGILRSGYGVEGQLAHFLAYFCEGRLGEALRLKDAGILRAKNEIIDKLVFSSSAAQGLSIEERKDFRFALNILAAWFRDIYLLKSGAPETEAINCDRLVELTDSLKGLSFLDLEKALNCLSTTSFYLERNINNRLLLHNLKVQICQR